MCTCARVVLVVCGLLCVCVRVCLFVCLFVWLRDYVCLCMCLHVMLVVCLYVCACGRFLLFFIAGGSLVRSFVCSFVLQCVRPFGCVCCVRI